MSKKTTIRELYFYKKHNSNLYAIDIVNGRNESVEKIFTNLTKRDVKEILTSITNKKNNKYSESTFGMQVHNKLPKDKILSHKSDNIVEVYTNNLKQLQESSESRHLAADLLRSAAALLDHDDYPIEADCKTPHSEPEEYEPEETQPCDPSVGVVPQDAVSTEVPFEIINEVQEKLNVTIDLHNLTFRFNSQKWQLQTDVDTHVSSVPKRPKAANNIISSMDYMSTLLGVNGEKSLDPDSLFFRFPMNQVMYKISNVYIGDGNTIQRN